MFVNGKLVYATNTHSFWIVELFFLINHAVYATNPDNHCYDK